MAARNRFPPFRFAAFVVVAAAISGSGGPTAAATAAPPPPPPAPVPPAALLPTEAIPGPPAPRDTFDVATAVSTLDAKDDGGCTGAVHGRLLRGTATGQGFQTAVPGGQFSELVARTPQPPDLVAWTAKLRECTSVTVTDQDLPTVSTLTTGTAPAIPGAETLSYQQVLTLPGQPAELPGLRLRTVAVAAGDVLLVLRDAGATDLDLDALAVTAWQHAAPRLGR